MIDAPASTSTRPYLIRALYEWCIDNGLTPYLAVQVDDSVQVPREYVKDGEIVLNVSVDATSSLQIGNDIVAFSARFAGKAREIMVPVDRIIAIYARENGQGMAFPRPSATPAGAAVPVPDVVTSLVAAVPREAGAHAEPEVKLLESVPSASQSPPKELPPGTSAAKKRPKLTRIK